MITRDAGDCSTCHFNFGGQNQAIAEYNQAGQITVIRWDEGSRRIDGPEGVVPIPMEWRTSLIFDFAVYTGDPVSSTSDPQAWEFLKTGFDNGHLFLAEPLDADAAVTVGSDLAVAPLTIRQDDDPAVPFPQEVPSLTVFPVIPGRADLTAPGAIR